MSRICSREQRQNDDRRNLGDPCRSAVGNCAQEDDSDGSRVAEQLVGPAFVQDGERDGEEGEHFPRLSLCFPRLSPE